MAILCCLALAPDSIVSSAPCRKLHAPNQFLHSRRALDDCGAGSSCFRSKTMMTLAQLSDFGVALGGERALIVEPYMLR